MCKAILILISSAIFFGTAVLSEEKKQEAENPLVHPLVDTFTEHLSEFFKKSTSNSEDFNLANLPGLANSHIFKEMIDLMMDEDTAEEEESSTNALISSLDNFDPANIPLVLGHVYGKSLLERQLMSEDNVGSLSKALAGDLGSSFKEVDSEDQDGYVMAFVNACSEFYDRLGLSLLEVAPELNSYLKQELLSLKLLED